VLNTAARLFGLLERAMLALACLALFALMILTTADAFLRYLFNAPITGAQELADEFLMPAIIYFAMTYVYSSGGHIRINIVSDQLPERVQRACLCLWDAIAAFMMGLIAYGVWTRTVDSYRFREYSTSPLDYLLTPSYAIVAIGATLMALRLAAAALTANHPKVGNLSLDH
jgi:TRAP-type C4-dicarboxylate transport system permease small subunit